MKKLTSLVWVGLALLWANNTQAQIQKLVREDNGKVKQVVFDETQSKTSSQLIYEFLEPSSDEEFVLLKSTEDVLGFTHEKYQQYYKGVKVEYGTYTIHRQAGNAKSMNGEYTMIDDFDVTPALRPSQALTSAINQIGASKYLWEDAAEASLIEYEKPKGELVIYQEKLAYKFDIYALQPISRAYVYIDAKSGEFLGKNDIIHHADAIGTAATRYSGSRSIHTDSNAGSYRLRDYSRGNGILTYDMNNGTNYNSAVDFTDNDNNWTSGEHANAQKDDAALDAHWGAEMTYDYFLQTYGRNSFDNAGAAIRSYVHFNLVAYGYPNNDNAFWDGSRMTYGDGTSLDPLTTLDIAAHEIGHAVCTYTADLVYSYESGALNEAYSDIWAASVEYFAAPEKNTWILGEDLGAVVRSLEDPKAAGQPDTYLGTNWYTGSGDNGGVHYNSGVLNHWFYILSVGKSGTNDNGDSYNVTGIGIDKAAEIAYRTESVYLSSNSQYSDARNYSIQAAEDLYGVASAEAIATQNAFYAVGVGAAYNPGGSGACSATISSFPYTESFESGAGDWVQGSDDDIDWTRDASGTPSSSTGPSSASDGSYYMYVEASSPNYPSKTANLYGPCFDLSGAGSATFSFDYHMYGATMGTLSLQARVGTGSWSSVWSLSGNQGNSWNSQNVDLSSYAGVEVQLRFVGTTGSSYTSDMTVDNLELTTGGGTSCDTPTGLAGSSIAETTFTMSWDAVSGADSYDLEIDGSIISDNTIATSVNVTGAAAGTTYSCRVRSNCGGTSSAWSAAVDVTTTSSPGGLDCSATVSAPYSESFENTLGAWSNASGDDFDWTTRSGSTPSSNTGPSGANDGTYYVYVESSSPNYSNMTAILNGPCFDLAGVSAPTLSFKYHMYGASNMGGLVLEATTDDNTWSSIWSMSGNQGNSWQDASIDLSGYAGSSVKVRFVGTTGTTWQGDMAIDKLALTDGSSGGGNTTVTLTIVLDNYPEETSWTVTQGGTTYASGGTYGSQPDGSTVVETFDLPAGCYNFNIFDTYGDGICCAYGNGSYTVTAEGSTLASGGSFGSSETQSICVGGATFNAGFLSRDNQNKFRGLFNTYPNPVNDILTIQILDIQASAYSIHDLSGKELQQGLIESKNVEISMKSLPDGMYLLKLINSKGHFTTKIIKE